MGVGAYALHRGVRSPTNTLQSLPLDNQFSFSDFSALTQELIVTSSDNQMPRFRAYAPEPQITLRALKSSSIEFIINNISIDAKLETSGTQTVNEEIEGITRRIRLSVTDGSPITLAWKLPYLSNYKFASIGDTGGDKELAWCIQRAAALDAKFLLHLGDFNYQEGDYQRSIDLFSNSAIPCYVSIGNHDFHTDGILVSKFTSEIGPLNNVFSVGRTRFANIDTAADIFPHSVGHRGAVLEALAQDSKRFADTVVFTHKPLNDPMEGNNHDIRNDGERDWLIEMFKQAQVSTVLSGHIHIYHRGFYQGIENIIAGQGLGHQDLIVNADYSKMVLGHVGDDGKLTFTAEPLAMPMNLHCHPRVDVVKRSLIDSPHYSVIEDIDRACRS